MKLSVIIVNYNVSDFLAQCLDTVREAVAHINAEVWVVDNNSTDGSADMVRLRHPWVRLIVLKENVGFSKGNNIAIRQAQGEYILLLNPDTLVAADTLQRCMDYLDTHPTAGATGARMLDATGRFAFESRRGIPTPFTSFCKMSGLTNMFPHSKRFGRYYMRYLNEREPAEIEIISGAFMMLRRRALDDIGLLDERFFMYGEDIDISYRILLAGWTNHYVPAPLLHYKGESTHKSSFRYVHVFYNAMLIFYNKHFQMRYRGLTYIIKAAVIARGAVDYMQKQVRNMMQFLLSARTNTSLFVLCMKEADKAYEVCRRNNLNVLRSGDIHGKHDSIMVISHEDMMKTCSSGDRLEAMLEQISAERSELGIYNPRKDIIITSGKIFR